MNCSHCNAVVLEDEVCQKCSGCADCCTCYGESSVDEELEIADSDDEN